MGHIALEGYSFKNLVLFFSKFEHSVLKDYKLYGTKFFPHVFVLGFSTWGCFTSTMSVL